MNRTEIEITPGAFITAAACVLLLPLNWLFAAVFAAAIHELGHIIALRCCGIRILNIRIGSCGAMISTIPLSPEQEILCAATGPICSLTLLLIYELFPLLSLIGLIQGVFNLLPIYPMDGGRIVKGIIAIIREKSAE